MKKNFTPHYISIFYNGKKTEKNSSHPHIRKLFLFFSFLFLIGMYAFGQLDMNSQWTWVSGDKTANQPGVYGTRGVTSQGNLPGARIESISWTDIEGNLWLMGGAGYAEYGAGWLNDLWKYNPISNEWVWLKGSKEINELGVYGTQGIAEPNNVPGAREAAFSWTDNKGKLWMMGGLVYTNNSFGNLNDLWKYDPKSNEWSWMKGDKITNQPGIYGIKGLAEEVNKPGTRQNAVTWTGHDGKLWLMGGLNISEGRADYFNDLWNYDPETNKWTWVNGDSIANQSGIYGTQGVADESNKPGARQKAISWIDKDGKLWLMGGIGYATYGIAELNDLWKYDPKTNLWTWVNGDSIVGQPGVYGIQGVPDSDNKPGGRYSSVCWVDHDNNFWLFGGQGRITKENVGILNDLWKYDMDSNKWTWVKGDNIPNQSGIYGARGIMAEVNKPGSREDAISWTNKDGKLILMGGSGYVNKENGFLNDLWKFDPENNEWMWIKGDSILNQQGVYGTMGIPSNGSKPGSRWGAVSWTDCHNILWLFGGEGFTPKGFGWLNDLWKYNPATNEWTWVKGSNSPYDPGFYATKGVPGDYDYPGGRHFAGGWIDKSGKLWLFGGYGIGMEHMGYFNDLWCYNPVTNQWAWMKGDLEVNIRGVYGNKGMPSAGNKPGGREHVVSWTGNDGKLWLMSGYGFAASGIVSHQNDLWNYNVTTNEWTWVTGDSTGNMPGYYTVQGLASKMNKPGGRWGATGWTDPEGMLWMIGGWGYGAYGSGYLNDLWKYNPVTGMWTWMRGEITGNHEGEYGVQGNASNGMPGGRTGAVSWIDPAGKFWLMGGNGYAADGFGSMNDLWKYDPSSNLWTWEKGDSIKNQQGIYGSIGVSAPENKPGSREQAWGWTTNDGRLWLMGGNATTTAGVTARLNDLWVLEPTIYTYYKDEDGDGFGNPDKFIKVGCIQPGYVLKAGDCNDQNAQINPDAPEICDGVDNNCNGKIDEGCPPSKMTIISVDNITIHEGNEGYRNAVFILKLSRKSSEPVYVNYHTENGSAVAPEDYKEKYGTVYFPVNTLYQMVTVKVRGDRVKEQIEKFRLVLSDPYNAVIKDSSASCTIIDNDSKDGFDNEHATGESLLQIDQPLSLKVNVFPNPGYYEFQVIISGNGKGPIHLRITDIGGRILEDRNLEGTIQPIRVGHNWINGTYILQLIQGTEIKTVQLIKLR